MDNSPTIRSLNKQFRPNQTFPLKLPEHHDCSHGFSSDGHKDKYNMRTAVSHENSIYLVCLNCGKAERCWVI